jgi:hypothetical protein
VVRCNSLFRNILRLTPCESRFCEGMRRPATLNSREFNILTRNDEKRLGIPCATNFTLFKILAVKYCATRTTPRFSAKSMISVDRRGGDIPSTKISRVAPCTHERRVPRLNGERSGKRGGGSRQPALY